VVSVEQVESEVGVGNVIIPQGHVIANGIAVSIRCDGDFPEPLMTAGNLIYHYLGTSATHRWC